jgi:hypothetical protein
MNKDIIYIDVEDDITSIVEKVKSASGDLVTLVPPKRIGILQSSVNLKLVKKAADSGDKRLVLVTADPALTALAATVQIPVAKNLQSKPTLAAATDDDETDDDVIHGEEIAIGDLADTTPTVGLPRRRREPEDRELSAAVAKLEADEDGAEDDKPLLPRKKPTKSKKIPNFGSFRKKLLIFGSLGLALIAFLIWAIWFAPAATITVTAKTTPETIRETLTLDPSRATNTENNMIQPVVKQKKVTKTEEFDATGTKEIGEAATGSVVIYNTNEIGSFTVPAGTVIANGNLQYKLDGAVTVPSVSGTLASPKAGVSGAVRVTATNIGAEYNIGTDNTLAIAGYDASAFYAKPDTAFTGGSRETVKIVQQADLDKAADKLKSSDESDKTKAELVSQMGSDVTVLDDSFTVTTGDVISKPAVGEKVSGRATASFEITYTVNAVSNRDLNDFLSAKATKLIENSNNQRVYSNGFKKLQLSSFKAMDGGQATVRLTATVEIGPKLDEDKIKQNSVGLRSGEIRALLTETPGVEAVDVKFSPFWVSHAPDAKKITIKINE